MSDDSGQPTPSNPPAVPSGATGLLDIKVQLSTPSPTAGSEFTVYVLVTNLFDRPIYPEEPRIFLPSELKPANRGALSAQESVGSMSALLNQIADGEIPESVQPRNRGLLGGLVKPDEIKEQLKYMAQKAVELDQKIETLTTRRAEIKKQLDEATQDIPIGDRIKLLKEDPALNKLNNEDADCVRQIADAYQRATTLKTQITNLTGATVVVTEEDLTLSNFNFSGRMYIQAKGDVELSAPNPSLQALSSSSLPPTEALQPGSTAVYSLVLTTKQSLFFRPVQYTLQYSINYSFSSGKDNKKTYTNNASQLVTIRAPILSVMFGAILGGIAGFFATFLQKSYGGGKLNIDPLEMAISLVVTVILSAMAVVFLVRKSETQSLISVEDFWGGLVIGFLVGYSGTNAFQSLTGIDTLAGVSATPVP